MTREQEELMKEHGITVVHEPVYRFEEFRYRRLEDAVNYARKQLERI